MCPYVLERNALSATEDVYIHDEICTLSYRGRIYTSKFQLLCDRFGGRMMVLRCCFWLFNDGNFLVIYSPNFRMFLTFDFWIILSITIFFRRQMCQFNCFWGLFSYRNFSNKKRCILLTWSYDNFLNSNSLMLKPLSATKFMIRWWSQEIIRFFVY